MQIETTGDNESVIIHATADETAVIKEALLVFFNSKPEKNLSPEMIMKRRADKKIAFLLHEQFPEPQIEYSHLLIHKSKMIIAEVFYGVKCDRCGEICDDTEHAYYMDESEATEQALESEWGEINGKHYCPNCHIVNEETDEVEPFPAFPQHIKLIRKFFTSTIRCYREGFEEKNNTVTLNYSLINVSKIDPISEKYIRDYLGENLIDIAQSQEKNHQAKISISIKL